MAVRPECLVCVNVAVQDLTLFQEGEKPARYCLSASTEGHVKAED